MNTKDLRKGKDDLAAIQFMIRDILDNILQYSENPGEMGRNGEGMEGRRIGVTAIARAEGHQAVRAGFWNLRV